MCRLCNNNENFTHNICKNCYDKTPSTFNKNDISYRIYILHCNLNYLYMSNSSNTLCPICYKKQVYCKTCNKLLNYKILENHFSNHFLFSYL